MSEAHNTAAPATATAPADTTTAAPAVDAHNVADRVVAAPVVNGDAPKTHAETSDAAPTTDGAVVTEEAASSEVTEKAVEPITEGQLAYKGPGLVKSLIPSKKEFWLDDSAVSPSNLSLYLRGEKPEVAHPVVAWASQTGKGLLFFNKKGEINRAHPHDILPLYDATELKQEHPHSFSFKINGKEHSFKATSDAERDGWYISIEKSIELGKASKQEVRDTAGYTEEFEKLSKPSHAVPAVVTKRNQSNPKKSAEGERATSSSSSSNNEGEKKEKKKSRSTSRGILQRLQSGKKETKAEKDEEKKVEAGEVTKPEGETAEPVLASTEAAPVHAAVATAEIPSAGEDKTADHTNETAPLTTEEKTTKPNKRASIFGRVSSGWSSIKSPTKEKEQKDAELKIAEPHTTEAVSENPPVLPETATTEPVPAPVVPAVEEPAVVDKKTENTTPAETSEPTKEKSNFLTTLMNRARSVSPSTQKKEQHAKKEETTVAPVEEAKVEEPAVVATEPAAATTVEPTSPVAEKTEEPTSKADKRQSVLGNLGRRASKALNRIQTPKKETSTAAETKKEENAVEKDVAAPATTETTSTLGPVAANNNNTTEEKAIGDVVPDAVSSGHPQNTTAAASPAPVTASA
ncbi:unnamed protein product [Zymoseptoria tritici ST99CH_3D7]|uniref:PH domain-containing protein n=1 Tax=Zymoseptoria tritici (strain ST99CH_3D7) TaxID=1276538 RepID=A0A1X7RIH6_ZYMT9|nr:unnamed protein product [Zymoseptoria tritici ST99CH_3D7]